MPQTKTDTPRAPRPPRPEDDRGQRQRERRPDDPNRPPGRERGHDPFARDDRHDGGPARPILFVPYYPGDDGDRTQPFPAGVLSYLCPGIKIRRPDGSPYSGGTLPRNETATVSVDVANAGTEGAWAQVALYWADPSAGFAPPYLNRPPEVGSPRSVYVSPGATEPSPSITLRPTLGTPDHICLIAVVSATNDPPSGSWNPLADGHYAQHNLDIVHVDAGGVGAFQFYAANPFREAARMTVRFRPATGAENRTLGALYATQPLELAPDALRLMSGAEAAADRPARELALTLDGGERRLCQGLVAAEGLRPGDVVAAEVETIAVPLRGERATELRGSFGVVVFVGG